ncbi:MAG: hypothetical protein P4L87_07790, partial [Formivibrio sp.]|nr:hypothetical protein [Formivibrio sp.]
APTVANWYFGGGYGPTTLSATSGNNVFLASMGGSTMTGGSGTDTFIIPETGTGFRNANDSIINFHVGDSATLEGAGGAGWTYQWLAAGGLTMDASNATLGLSELVTFSGMTIDDTNHLNVTTDASGNLSIVSTNAGTAPAIMVRDNTTGKNAYQFGKYSGIVLSPGINELMYMINYQLFFVPTVVQDIYLYSGNDNISMTAPVGKNWEFGGGSGFTTLTAISGFNTFVASTGSSLMIGGTGTNVAGTSVPMSEDTFVIPNANLTGVSTSDTIVNFHVGDTVTLNGVGGSGWTYAWYTESSGGNYSGLTLYATSATTPGLTELVTFSGLTVNNLNYFSVTTTPTGDLSIISTNVDPPPTIPLYDQTTGQSSIETGSFSSASTASDPIGFTGIQSVFTYTGSDKIILSAPAGANWTFGGGSGLTGLVATSGDNVFKASTGSSFMIGGTGFDKFDIPDANLTGQGTWDTVVNFHVGDSISLAGLSGTGWKYHWLLNDGAQGSTGLTLYATSTNTLGLSELVTFSGLTAADLSHMKITSDATTGVLTITDNAWTWNSSTLLAFDQTTGQPVTGDGIVNTDPTIVGNDGTIITNISLYNGSAAMQFLAPPGNGSWEFGGGSGQTALCAFSGNNILLASTGGSSMTGGSGHNQFIVPDATLTGVPTWDTITDFHAGDSVILKDLLGPGWSYFFAPHDMGAIGNMGLTLEAKNPSMPGSAEMVTFSNLHASNLASLVLSQGTGANYGSLIISMSPLPA